MLLMSLNILLLCTQGWPMAMACTLHMAGKFPNEKYVGGFLLKMNKWGGWNFFLKCSTIDMLSHFNSAVVSMRLGNCKGLCFSFVMI